ncbi:PVC-type heme-binding CxxCH protein [Cyclobacterium marinum]|uniref:PVC-type heme-binding CxxCH protein n=1 Tax=Cyclobacterium marinum TaxID=104 RepID=UPI0011ED75E7|nr:PVC-type heme-binding CxxCH protein [Cyclobacterium marinum]MBI0397520.1 c-type cytochrome [Cyclobacterium marinum]
MQKITFKNKIWMGLIAFAATLVFLSTLDIWEGASRQLPGIQVPEGFEIEEAILPGLVQYPMFGVFDDRGRLFVMESSGHTEGTEEILKEPNFQILLLTDTNLDGIFDHKTVYVDNLPFPMGGAFVDGSLIVSGSPDLIKFTDNDGDGIAEEKEVLLTGWTLNHNAAILSGPFMGPDGWLYMADARRGFDIQSKEFVNFKGKGARIWRCLPNGTQLQSFAGGGFDNSIELAFTPSGDVLGTMTYFTDPQGGYRDALMHWVEDGVYPKHNAVIAEDNLVRTGSLMPVMHKMARVSPSGLMRYEGDIWGNDYEGNLFHAEFNTGRIVKTVLSASGASYEADSEHFMTSSLSDFHPTDVLQEPDGNLLVVNTGGWFISGCPLSRTAKPEVPGGIFRIRKKKIDPEKDPWGNKIAWESLSVPELVGLLEDTRWKVSEKAGEYLLKQPLAAIPYLVNVLATHPDEAIRTKAVFLLFRTQNPRAWNQLVLGLKDKSDQVKIATARVVGMAEVISAKKELIQLLDKQPNLALARQVAVALGQIGDPEATTPLLKLMKTNGADRFISHAVIFALIQMENEDLLLEELKNGNFNKAALIALDQKQSPLLKENLVQNYLSNSDSTVRGTALWVLENHSDWEVAFTNYLKYFFKEGSGRMSELEAILPTFIDEQAVQNYLASVLDRTTITEEEKLKVLQSLEKSPPKELLPALKGSLFQLLNSSQKVTQKAVINLAVQLKEKTFIPAFNKILTETKKDASLKLAVYNGLVSLGESLSTNDLKWVAEQLLVEGRQALHGEAINILRNLDLNIQDLSWLLQEILPKSASGDVSYLLELFDDVEDVNILVKLEEKLLDRQEVWANLSIHQLELIFGKSKAGKTLIDSLEARQEERITELEELAEGLVRGDVDRGRAIFYGVGACSTCHAVSGKGETFGPDLTNIGEIRSKHDILEAMLFPGVSFAREYETVTIQTEGQKYIGIIKGFENGRYELAVGPGSLVTVDEKDIISLEEANQSLMPAGLIGNLSNQEISDLMHYLQSLPDGIYTRNN